MFHNLTPYLYHEGKVMVMKAKVVFLEFQERRKEFLPGGAGRLPQ